MSTTRQPSNRKPSAHVPACSYSVIATTRRSCSGEARQHSEQHKKPLAEEGSKAALRSCRFRGWALDAQVGEGAT